MYDPEIYVAMGATMKAIQRAVSCGYVHYVTGQVEVNRVQALVAKFDDFFHISATDKRREYAAKKKRCSFRLVLYPNPGRTDFKFWLLRTDGEHPLLSTQRWRDARTDPILWPFLYELRQVPVPPKHRERFRRKDGQVAIRPVTWSWRFQRAEMDRLRSCIRHWVQHRDERLRRLIRGLGLAPGFRAVRDDVYVLQQYIARQCQKRNVPVPAFPGRRGLLLGKGRSFTTFPLSQLVARIRRGASAWFPSTSKSTDTVGEQALLEKPDAQAVRQAEDPRQNEADASPAG